MLNDKKEGTAFVAPTTPSSRGVVLCLEWLHQSWSSDHHFIMRGGHATWMMSASLSPTDPHVRCRMQETYVKGEGEIDRAEMHNRYRAFCESRGIPPKDLANFGKIVKVLTLVCLLRGRHVRAFTQRALLGSLSLSLDAPTCSPQQNLFPDAGYRRLGSRGTSSVSHYAGIVLRYVFCSSLCGSTYGFDTRIRIFLSWLTGCVRVQKRRSVSSGQVTTEALLEGSPCGQADGRADAAAHLLRDGDAYGRSPALCFLQRMVKADLRGC